MTFLSELCTDTSNREHQDDMKYVISTSFIRLFRILLQLCIHIAVLVNPFMFVFSLLDPLFKNRMTVEETVLSESYKDTATQP